MSNFLAVVLSWYISEYDPIKKLCFGLVDGFEKELGYFSLDELLSLKFPPLNLGIERMFALKVLPLRS